MCGRVKLYYLINKPCHLGIHYDVGSVRGNGSKHKKNKVSFFIGWICEPFRVLSSFKPALSNLFFSPTLLTPVIPFYVLCALPQITPFYFLSSFCALYMVGRKVCSCSDSQNIFPCWGSFSLLTNIVYFCIVNVSLRRFFDVIKFNFP